MVPSPAGLAEALRDLPADGEGQLQRAMELAPTRPAMWQWVAGPDGPLAFAAGQDASGPRLVEHSIEEVHRLWRLIPEPRPPHPLAPIVAAWQSRPVPARDWRPRIRGSLPRWQRLTAGGTGPALELPATDIPGHPGWISWMYERVGGMKSRHGAPWPLRLHVAAMLHLHVDERDGRWRTIRLPLEQVESWIHPEGWSNRRRDWHRLPAALDALHVTLSHMPVQGVGSVAVMIPTVIPREPTAPLVEFTVRVPAAAAHGARIDWPALCAYGAESATLYRAFLSAAVLLDHAAHRGHAPTAWIARPMLDDAGRPRRGKGGRIQRTDEVIPSPAARFVRPMSEADLARLAGFHGEHHEYRRRARAAFERLDADGVIDLQRDGRGWRIFGPATVQPGVS